MSKLILGLAKWTEQANFEKFSSKFALVFKKLSFAFFLQGGNELSDDSLELGPNPREKTENFGGLKFQRDCG